MNETQTIFTLFFAISWGIVSNVLPRWKPFHYAMFWHQDFWQPTRRIFVAFTLMNIVPWLVFVIVLVWLRGDSLTKDCWTLSVASFLIVRAILPGLVPFGCYRLWLAIIQTWSNYFYAESQLKVPEEFRVAEGCPTIEPDKKSLNLQFDGACNNLCFGVLYIAFSLLSLIPSPM